jgi:hypothetical protein
MEGKSKKRKRGRTNRGRKKGRGKEEGIWRFPSYIVSLFSFTQNQILGPGNTDLITKSG